MMNQRHNCDQCDKSFSSLARLNSHKRVHNNRETQCDQCGQVFPSAQACAGHMKCHDRVVYVPRLPCLECGRTFLSEQDRQVHMNNHHQEERRQRHSSIDMNFPWSHSKSFSYEYMLFVFFRNNYVIFFYSSLILCLIFRNIYINNI